MGKNSGNSYLVCKNFFVINMLSAFDVCYIYSSALQIRFYHGSKDYEPLGAGEQYVRFGSKLFALKST